MAPTGPVKNALVIAASRDRSCVAASSSRELEPRDPSPESRAPERRRYPFSAACAAASRATGTRYGEQLT